MVLYILLIVAFGLVILVSIGTLIFGLIKKRKNILISAAILFVVGVIGCVFSGLIYSKKVYEYVKSKNFKMTLKKVQKLSGRPLVQFHLDYQKDYQRHLTMKQFLTLLKNPQQFWESQ